MFVGNDVGQKLKTLIKQYIDGSFNLVNDDIQQDQSQKSNIQRSVNDDTT